MWFLGTCSAPAPSAAHGPSLSLRAGSDIWFFDCADDTQRQIQKVSTGVPPSCCEVDRMQHLQVRGALLVSMRTHG